MERLQAIGVFDSGVGGFSVVRALQEELPHETILYLGDTARVPYGTKSPETVIRYSLKNARFLVQQGIKMLVVACNTASAHSIPVLREELDIPVVGVIEPGAVAAIEATGPGQIGVIGTFGTISSGAYEDIIQQRSEGRIRTAGEPCPLFVPLAEEGWLTGEVPSLVAREYLGRLYDRMPDLDVLVLGCTHYPILREMIQKEADAVFGRRVLLIDSGVSAAAVARMTLEYDDLLHLRDTAGKLRVFVTDTSRIREVGERFLGKPLTQVERVDI